jgi:hypothetical protein
MKHTPGPWNIRNELDERGLFVIVLDGIIQLIIIILSNW